MIKLQNEPHVIPRPVEALPEYANAKSRHGLANRITEAFGLSDVSARVVANAVVDPSAVRKSIGDPDRPEAEEISVPGGTLLGVRTNVWVRRIMPDPRNPRTLPSRRHPYAIEPGTGGEDSKFKPVSEPQPLDPDQPDNARVGSRHRKPSPLDLGGTAGRELRPGRERLADFHRFTGGHGSRLACRNPPIATTTDRQTPRRLPPLRGLQGSRPFTTCCKFGPAMSRTRKTTLSFGLTSAV